MILELRDLWNSLLRRWIFCCVFIITSHTNFAQTPTITSFTPTSLCSGETVTITGTNFTGATAVKFGNTNAASFTINSATSITAVTETAGSASISVITPNGPANSTGSITILPAPLPGLTHVGFTDREFTNCNGNASYTLNVSNSSTAAGGSCKYEINWGDASAFFTQTDWPNGGTTSHTYNAQGYFNITLTITPTNGCKKIKNYKFYNGTNPLASLTTTSPTTGLCTPAAIEFQIGNWFNNSTGTVYELDFGDGKTTSLSHPLNNTNTFQLTSHTYTTSSCPNPDFTATLNAMNGCFVTKYTLNQIVIRKKPTADFSVSTPSACINTPICFTNLTTGGFSGNFCNNTSTYTWDFGDGSPISNSPTPPCHSYTTKGTYTVTLTTSNAACGSDTKIKQIQVKDITLPPTVSTSILTYCQNKIAPQLTATGKDLLWYTSLGGFGSTTAPTPPTFSQGSTTYYVSQSGGANGCESTKVPITVNVTPAPNPPTVSDIALCQNQTATALTATGTNLLWYTTPLGVGSAIAPIPSTATISNYTFYVTQTANNCESNKSTINVNVNSFPSAPVAAPSTIVYCQGQSASQLFVPGNNLRWYTVPNLGTASLIAPVPQTANVGITTYYVSQFSGCGESPRTPINVEVKASPSATIAYNPTNLCNVAGASTVDPTQTGATGGIYSILPSFGLAIDPTTGKLSPAGATPRQYTITYTIPGVGGCGNFTTTTTVNVNGSPTAAINYPATICTSELPASVVLIGSTGGVFSSTTGLTIDPTTGTITASTSTPGLYTITYTILPAAPCPGFTTTATVTITKAPIATISYTPTNLCNVTNSPSTPNPPISVTLTGTGGGNFNVLPIGSDLKIDATTGTITPSGATPRNYIITYTIPGIGGCSDLIVTTPVSVNGAPTATLNYPGSPYCHSISIPQQANLTGSTGGIFSADAKLSIDQSTGDINPSLSTPGTYTVTYTILASPPCPGFITTANVIIDESPTLIFPLSTQTICSGESKSFTPISSVANTNYTWSVMGVLPANVVGLKSGTASAVNPDIVLSFTNTGTISESIKVEVIPINASVNPCSGAPYLITLIVNPAPQATIGNDTVNFCLGAPTAILTANALPGNSLNWYNETQVALTTAPIISTATPGEFTYYVSQSNSFGCESPKSKILAIVNPTPKIISSSFTSPPTCGVPSGSIVLNILDINGNAMPNTPATVYYDKFLAPYQTSDTSDANGKITIPLVGGTYKNIYVETKGCASQKIPDVFVLKDPTPPAKPVAGYNPPLCSGTQLNLSASSPTSSMTGPIDYVWVGPAFGSKADTNRNTVVKFPNAKVTDAGTYIVYAIQNNCISEEVNFLVEIKQAPSKPQITTTSPLCVGDNLNLQASSSIPGPNPTLTYLWGGPGRGFPVSSSTAQINKVIIQDAGRYSITVTSPSTGCSTSSDTLIQIGGYPIVKFAKNDYVLPAGNRLLLQPTITNGSSPNILPIKLFEWTPSQDIDCNDAVCATPIANIKNDGCYIVKATNIYGCSGTDTICVKVFCEKTQVFIPNTFTPQGGLPENSVLMVRGSGISSIKSFRIFNRWGQIVFEKSNFTPNSPAYGWDGNVNGKPAEPAVYVYTAEVICENGVPFTYKGNVTLLK